MYIFTYIYMYMYTYVYMYRVFMCVDPFIHTYINARLH